MTQALAGYSGQIKIGGTSTASNDEPCGGAGTDWQITNAAKRFIDPASSLQVIENGVPLPAAAFVINYFNGKITLSSGSLGPITISYYYIPLYSIATAHALELNIKNDLIDSSIYAYTATHRSCLRALSDVDGKFTMREAGKVDHDTTGDTKTIWGQLSGRTVTALEIITNWADAAAPAFRCWALINGGPISGGVGDQISMDASFVVTKRTDANIDPGSITSWSFTDW